MDTFQQRISALFREAKDANYRLNQKDFAVRFGASRSQLKGWLCGAGAPSTIMLRTIAKECNVSADWLIGGTDIRTPVEEFAKKLDQSADNLANPLSLAELGKIMNSFNPEELKFLEQYRLMDELQKNILQKIAEIMVSTPKDQ